MRSYCTHCIRVQQFCARALHCVLIHSQMGRSAETHWPGTSYERRIMCSYKLCRVEAKYWGVQGRVERFIHDSALRRTMLSAHRQAWVWQDEWLGLRLDDIRKLEADAQKELQAKFSALSASPSPESAHQPQSQSQSQPASGSGPSTGPGAGLAAGQVAPTAAHAEPISNQTRSTAQDGQSNDANAAFCPVGPATAVPAPAPAPAPETAQPVTIRVHVEQQPQRPPSPPGHAPASARTSLDAGLEMSARRSSSDASSEADRRRTQLLSGSLSISESSALSNCPFVRFFTFVTFVNSIYLLFSYFLYDSLSSNIRVYCPG